jgi:hypothetical protein
MWGSLGSRLGREQIVPLEAPREAVPLLIQCHKRCLSHGYQLVIGIIDVEHRHLEGVTRRG